MIVVDCDDNDDDGNHNVSSIGGSSSSVGDCDGGATLVPGMSRDSLHASPATDTTDMATVAGRSTDVSAYDNKRDSEVTAINCSVKEEKDGRDGGSQGGTAIILPYRAIRKWSLLKSGKNERL